MEFHPPYPLNLFFRNTPRAPRTVTVFRHPTNLNRIESSLPILRPDLAGPFDLIGDVHGCFDELIDLTTKLGYALAQTDGCYHLSHPEHRMLCFVGDLVDRGPKNAHCLHLVMDLVDAGTALCVPGNHDDKLRRALMGNKVQIGEALQHTLDQVHARGNSFADRTRRFIKRLPYHQVVDGGRLALVHAAMSEQWMGKEKTNSRFARAIYGKTTGGLDPNGYPERLDWTREYRGTTLVVYGHTPVLEPYQNNQTINIDTGCVFGNQLTALRYPERRFVSVRARRAYSERKGFLQVG